MKVDLLLGMDVFFHGSVVIQMLLMDIQKDCNVRRHMDIFQLMAGQLTHNACARRDLFQNIKKRNTDITGKNRVHTAFLQNMIKQGRGGTLSFGTGDPDDLFPVSFKEHFGLGSDQTGVFISSFWKYDSRTFEDHIIIL